SNAAVLATINNAAAAQDRGGMAIAMVTLVLSILIYRVSQKGLMVEAANLAESTVRGMRTRFIERLRAADLKDVEQLDRSAVDTAISGEMQVLSDGALNLIIVGQALVLLFVTMFYLAFLSLTALMLAAAFLVIAASIHLRRGKQIRDQLASAFQ